MITVADRVTSIAFAAKHPLSSFADSSVVLWSTSCSGVSSHLAEFSGAAPRLSQLSFVGFGASEAVCLQVIDGSGVAVGCANGRVSLLNGAGSVVNDVAVGGGPVEALCSLGERLICSVDDSLRFGDGSVLAALGWSAVAIASVDSFSLCCVGGRRIAVHDARTSKTALLCGLSAPAVSLAVTGQQVLVGLFSGSAVSLDLRRPEEAAAVVHKHAAGGARVAIGSGGSKWSAGRDGLVMRDGEVVARVGCVVDVLATEPRLNVCAAGSQGRVWLASQK